MGEMKVEHVLLFLVGAFLVYHMMGKCGICMNNLYPGITGMLEGIGVNTDDDKWTKPLSDGERRFVIIRHAEKPEKGLGTLSCKGLNRSLLIPERFSNLPPATIVIAPDPSVLHKENHGDGNSYNYIRPLLTIAPYAISLGLSVDTTIGAGADTQQELVNKLFIGKYDKQDIVIAWEHSDITGITNKILQEIEAPVDIMSGVGEWPEDDFDSIYRFFINTNDSKQNGFKKETQNITKRLTDKCPYASRNFQI